MMKNKWFRWSLQTLAFFFGIALGILRPIATQQMLSFVGIIVGLGYFFFSRRDQTASENAQKRNQKEPFDWFLLIQMLLAFIVGGAVGSTLIYFRLYL